MRYFAAVFLLFVVFPIVSLANVTNASEPTTPRVLIFPEVKKFEVSLSCTSSDKTVETIVTREVYYLRDPKNDPTENQWWGVTTDKKTGKKFGQWIIKSNGVWISSEKNWGLFFVYTPQNGWKEVDKKEFVRETRTAFKKSVLRDMTCK